MAVVHIAVSWSVCASERYRTSSEQVSLQDMEKYSSRCEGGDDEVAGSKAFIGRVKLVATVEGEVCNTSSQSMI